MSEKKIVKCFPIDRKLSKAEIVSVRGSFLENAIGKRIDILNPREFERIMESLSSSKL